MPTALYVDCMFLERVALEFALRHRMNIGGLQHPELSAVVDTILAMMRLGGLNEVHLFCPLGPTGDSFIETGAAAGGAAVQWHATGLVAATLARELQNVGGLKRVILVADDAAYPPLLRSVNVSVLIRRNSGTSAMLGLGPGPWQDVDYVLANAMHVPLHAV